MSITHRAALVAASATTVVAMGTVAPGPAGAADLGSGCTQYMAYLVPGTWETSPAADPTKPAGLLGAVGEKLKKSYGSTITVIYPNYSASAFDKGKTYAQSESEGVARLQDLIKRCPTSQNVLGGYSQGADVAGDVAWQIGHGKGPVDASKVDAVGLVADPKQGNAPVAGPTPDGKGIAGTRDGGFGELESKVRQLCAPGDLYCSTNSSQHSFLAGLGQTLGSAGNGETSPGSTTAPVSTTSTESGPAATTPDVSGLTSDYSRTDIPGTVATTDALATGLGQLSEQGAPTSGGQASQLASLASLAGQILETFTAVADTQQWVATTPGATKYVQGADPATPTGQANALLTTLGGMDIPAILNTATTIASGLSQALGSGPTVPLTPATAPDVSPAEPTVPTTTTTAAPSAPASTSTTTSSSTTTLSTTAPSSSTPLEGEGAGVVDPGSPPGSGTGEGSAPWQGTNALPAPGSSTTGATTSAPDIAGLTASAAQLVAQVAPLNAADKTALTSASSVLGGLKPDVLIGQGMNVITAVTSTDYAGIVANLQALPQQIFTGNIAGAHKISGDLNNQLSPWVKMAAQVDFKTAAKLVALVPDTSGTTAIASVVLGLLGNLDIIRLAKNVGQIQEVAWQVLETRNLFALTQLLPIGLDLASVALGVLEPGAKMSPELLGAGASPEQQALATASGGQDMTAMFGSLTQLVSSQGAQDLSKLVGEGLTAATFYASNAHGSYDKLVIDGKPALEWLYDFFRTALGG
ncbi:cutinase family protein [Williamsia limnetica]|uniref:cutinase family protein n=1 Tax=Williamsia limnetica TaxID=882452 RepID=UPI0011B54347|nr:cutinase family protein [Williamsia limnetica]